MDLGERMIEYISGFDYLLTFSASGSKRPRLCGGSKVFKRCIPSPQERIPIIPSNKVIT